MDTLAAARIRIESMRFEGREITGVQQRCDAAIASV
jgi:hypothetical protein